MYEVLNSKYTYKNTNVLKNKLGIKNEKELKNADTNIVTKKLQEIKLRKFKRTYDEKHFKFIHKFLFEELYEFAGKYREENILKENFRFSQFEYIDENIKKILKKIDLEKLKSENFEKQIEDVSEIMTDLNVLHPFREGNGRAIREFIRELLEDMGYEINFFNIEYEEIIEASKYAVFDETKQKNLLKKYIKSKKELN